MSTYTKLARRAASYLDKHGWTQGLMTADNGAACLHGAVRACSPRDGDSEIVRAVLRYKGYGEDWNDDVDREQEEVTNALRTVEITDADLAATFGPQWEAMVAFIRRITALTEEESKRLADVYKAIWDETQDANKRVLLGVARSDDWGFSRDAVLSVSHTSPYLATRYFVHYASEHTAWALFLRDQIGQGAFTQEDYDALTHPWATTIGKVHPDDKDLP